MSLDEHTSAFLAKANLNPPAPPGSIPLEVFRAAVDAVKPLGWDREELAEVRDVVVPRPGEEAVAVRLYRPDVAGAPPPVVCVHGGSWVRLTVDQLDEYYRALANRSGCVLAAVDYRLAPESLFPAAIEEVLAASRWLQESAADLGCDPERLAIFGESSGGNLAAAATLLARDRGDVEYSFQILLVPMLAMRFDSPSWKQFGTDYLLTQAALEWALDQYAPGVDRNDPLLSPLLADDFAGLPPTLVITGEYDPLRDDGERYAQALDRAGVAVQHWRVPGMIHHAPAVPKAIPSAGEFLSELGRRVNAAIVGPRV